METETALPTLPNIAIFRPDGKKNGVPKDAAKLQPESYAFSPS